MSSNICTETGRKRQRIMIIVDDESIIDQIGNNSNVSLLKEYILPFNSGDSERHANQAGINKPKNGSLICVVCGSSAHGYNFGAIVCESCKAFFRRNTRKDPTDLHCNNQGDCQITVETRRNCAACRLAKCFRNGMKRERLSTAEQKALKRRQLEENRKLVSNSSCQINEQECQLSDNLFSSIDTNILLTDFTGLLLRQPQLTLLTSEDIQRIETISSFYQKRIEYADRDGLPWNPSVHTKSFLQIINSRSVSIMRLLSFFKQIPEFNQLNVDDKVTLIKYNLPTVLSISSAIHYNTETKQLVESHTDVPMDTQFLPVLFGYKMCVKIGKIFSSFLYVAKYDRKIMELILIILILTKGFSTMIDYDEHILNDNQSVYRAQNYYIELLWKYMETMHGYQKTIDLFSQLIIHVIAWQTIQEQMRNDVLRTLSPEDMDQLLPIIKSFARL